MAGSEGGDKLAAGGARILPHTQITDALSGQWLVKRPITGTKC